MQYNVLAMIKKVFTAFAAALAAGLIFTSAVAAAPYSEENTPAEGTEQTEEAQSSSQVNSYARTYTGIFGTDAYLRIYLPIDISDEELAQATEKANALHEEIKALLTSLDSSMNIANENSYISQFNAAEAGSEIQIDKDTYEVLNIAIKMFEETDGYYNPGVYYSVDLYGFGVRVDYNERRPYDRDDYRTQLPDNEYVTAFQQLGESFAEVSTYQRDGKYYVYKPEKTVTVKGNTYSLAMDLGGIGKGYAIDLVDGLIDEAGFEYGYFNFGSSSQAINGSLSEDGKFELQFQHPRALLGVGYLSTRAANVAISTSGDYILSYTIDGTRYSHIINPKTGAPIRTGIATATVLDGRVGVYSAAEADARTTALCAMGVEKATEYMNELTEQGIMVAFLHENGIGWLTLYTNMEEDVFVADGVSFETDLRNELPSWVYLVICIGFVVVVVAAYAIVRVVKNRRKSKSVESNPATVQSAESQTAQSAENKAENAAVSGPSQAEGIQNTEKENKDGDL